MKGTDRKNHWRRIEATKVREQRIITGYVEIKHPEVYKEAANFYHLLNEKYPCKKDLRKTNEYEWLKAEIPGEITKKYYQRKKPYPDMNQKVSVEINKPSDKPNDNMQLIIPLMENPITTTVQPVETSVDPPVESMNIDKAAETQMEQTDKGETSDLWRIEESELIDPIPNDMIEEIITNLRQDPDLNSLFDDIDIEIDEISPLEKELMLL